MLAWLSACTAPAAPAGQTADSAAAATATISISGAFALLPVVSLWAEEYQQINPDVRFDIQGGGAGKGMTDVLSGAVDVAMFSRAVRVGLWDEVKDRLKAPATGLSGGQQQRLCLARTLAVQPEILLCDESTASLDPISARGIEELLHSLRTHYTVVMVTHDIEQARRLADYVLFMWLGELIEQAPATEFFAAPAAELTQAYLARRIG